MIRIFSCALLLLLALPVMAAEPDTFRFFKDIDRGTATGETILAVPFDSDVYAGSREGFPDVRVFRSEKQETPFVVERATEAITRPVRAVCRSKNVSLEERDEGLDVVVRREDDAPAANGVSIITPLRDYERRVQIFGSDDGENWTPLTTDGLVFDYSRYMDISNREVRLPENNYRLFKIRIEGIADAKESPFLRLSRTVRNNEETDRVEKTVLERRPFRMDRIELWRETDEPVSASPKKADYPAADFRVEEDASNKTTLVYFTMRREPVTEVSLATSSRNFNRRIEVQKPMVGKGKAEWGDLASGNVSLVDFGGYRKESLGISFPEQRLEKVRLVIHNEDSPPLAISGVAVRGNVYRAVFLAADGQTYYLAYDAEKIAAPKYDAAAVLSPLRDGPKPAECHLGVERANPAVRQCVECPMRGVLNNPVLLGAIVVVLAALLGYALVHAARRVNELPKE